MLEGARRGGFEQFGRPRRCGDIGARVSGHGERDGDDVVVTVVQAAIIKQREQSFCVDVVSARGATALFSRRLLFGESEDRGSDGTGRMLRRQREESIEHRARKDEVASSCRCTGQLVAGVGQRILRHCRPLKQHERAGGTVVVVGIEFGEPGASQQAPRIFAGSGEVGDEARVGGTGHRRQQQSARIQRLGRRPCRGRCFLESLDRPIAIAVVGTMLQPQQQARQRGDADEVDVVARDLGGGAQGATGVEAQPVSCAAISEDTAVGQQRRQSGAAAATEQKQHDDANDGLFRPGRARVSSAASSGHQRAP